MPELPVSIEIGEIRVDELSLGEPLIGVAADLSVTGNLTLADGAQIPIEERPATEITRGFGQLTAPADVAVYNPAFDVTPARFIAAIVTERGIVQPVSAERIREVVARPA